MNLSFKISTKNETTPFILHIGLTIVDMYDKITLIVQQIQRILTYFADMVNK